MGKIVEAKSRHRNRPEITLPLKEDIPAVPALRFVLSINKQLADDDTLERAGAAASTSKR